MIQLEALYGTESGKKEESCIDVTLHNTVSDLHNNIDKEEHRE